MKIWIVDAFTQHPFTGNPAGVVIFEQWPSDQLMQNIATELNFSNSAFVVPISEKEYHIRWFTPHSEAPLCGHATIAATKVLTTLGYINQQEQIVFKSLSGELFVSYNEGLISLSLPQYQVQPLPLASKFLDILGVQPIFSGFSENCLFMELDPHDLFALQPNLQLLMQEPCRALIATSVSEDKKYDFLTRYFAPKVGIPEDPVCGSSYSRLVPYWSKKLSKDRMIGYSASKRGGVVHCNKLKNRVLLSAHAVIIIEGKLDNLIFNELKNVA